MAQDLVKAEVAQAIEQLCAKFGDDYWLKHDASGEFPEEFYSAIAQGGWLGIAMPEAYGGSGLGISAAATMMRTIARSGAGMTGASAVHMNIFGLQPVVRFGTDEQKQRMLPPLIAGDEKACFGVTEANAGLDTSKIKSNAVRDGDFYRLNGSKIWISTAQVAHKILILVRTTPLDKVARPIDGLSLFYTDLDRSVVEVREIDKLGRHAVDSNMLFFEDWKVPAADRIGEEGNGFRQILHGLNPERILIASEAVGLGYAAIRKAAQYASERVVFNRPIGQNQGIQHPLARCWMNLSAAELMVDHAAALYDENQECGVQANTAKYLAGEASFDACQTAVMTHGGMGYSKEYHVERYLRECLITRIAPVSPQMIMNYISERVLDLPRSY